MWQAFCLVPFLSRRLNTLERRIGMCRDATLSAGSSAGNPHRASCGRPMRVVEILARKRKIHKGFWEATPLQVFPVLHCFPSLSGHLIQRRHSFRPETGKSVQRLAPVRYRHGPLFRRIPKRQVQQLHRRLVIRERAMRLDDLAQRPIQRFDCIGCIDRSPDLGRVGKNGVTRFGGSPACDAMADRRYRYPALSLPEPSGGMR